jgi:cupin 2 domain-containing protein
LRDRDAAPARGEETTALVVGSGFAVEQILSGELASPQRYEQDHDEWFVVVDGGAVLEVDGVQHVLERGDWWWLPTGTPHALLRTERGTSWLVVRSTG